MSLEVFDLIGTESTMYDAKSKKAYQVDLIDSLLE